jgi:hypothetical protein
MKNKSKTHIHHRENVRTELIVLHSPAYSNDHTDKDTTIMTMTTMDSSSTNQPPQLNNNRTSTSSYIFATQYLTHFDESDYPPMTEDTIRLSTFESRHARTHSSSVRSCYSSQEIYAMSWINVSNAMTHKGCSR